jgi:hypothetical protein
MTSSRTSPKAYRSRSRRSAANPPPRRDHRAGPSEGRPSSAQPRRGADLAFYRDVLGARVVFAIEAMGTRVAEVSLAPEGPRLVLSGHLAGHAQVLLHRGDDLEATLADLSELVVEARVERPLGPAAGVTYTWVNRHVTEGRRALRRAEAAAEAIGRRALTRRRSASGPPGYALPGRTGRNRDGSPQRERARSR